MKCKCQLRLEIKQLLNELENEIKALKDYLGDPGWNQDKLTTAIKIKENFAFSIKDRLTPFVEVNL